MLSLEPLKAAHLLPSILKIGVTLKEDERLGDARIHVITADVFQQGFHQVFFVHASRSSVEDVCDDGRSL